MSLETDARSTSVAKDNEQGQRMPGLDIADLLLCSSSDESSGEKPIAIDFVELINTARAERRGCRQFGADIDVASCFSFLSVSTALVVNPRPDLGCSLLAALICDGEGFDRRQWPENNVDSSTTRVTCTLRLTLVC